MFSGCILNTVIRHTACLYLKTNAIKLLLNPPVNTLNRNLALAPSSAASQGPWEIILYKTQDCHQLWYTLSTSPFIFRKLAIL